MKQNDSPRLALGALATIVAIWLGMFCSGHVAFSLLFGVANSSLPAPELGALEVPLLILIGLLIIAVTFTILAGAAGLICAFFWHPIAKSQNRKNWDVVPGFWVWLLALAPLILCYGAGLVVFLPSLVPFYRALDFGMSWWPNRGPRHLFGLTNDYERETDETR